MTSCVLVMARNVTGDSSALEGGIDVRFATRAASVENATQDVAFVAMRITRRRDSKLSGPVVSVVAQALVILARQIDQKRLPGTRQLWNDRLNGDRVATLEHLVEMASLGPQEAAAVARALEFCLAYATSAVTPGDLVTLLVQLQRTNARLVALCIEQPNALAQINADAIEMAALSRQIAAASIRRRDEAHV